MFNDSGDCLLWGEVVGLLLAVMEVRRGAKQVRWMARPEWRRPHRVVGMMETVLSPLDT